MRPGDTASRVNTGTLDPRRRRYVALLSTASGALVILVVLSIYVLASSSTSVGRTKLTVWMQGDASRRNLGAVRGLLRAAPDATDCVDWTKARDLAEAQRIDPPAVVAHLTLTIVPSSYRCEVTGRGASTLQHEIDQLPGVLVVTTSGPSDEPGEGP